MTTAEQLKSDILTLLLANRVHQHEPSTFKMAKIKDCCQMLLERTDDEIMIQTYCQIIRGIYDRRFVDITMMLHITETNFAKVYKL